jgi:hypothetical protein
MTWRDRYQQAHYHYQCREYPSVINDGHYTPPKMPNIKTEKGMVALIKNFINWDGGNVKDNRRSSGVIVDQPERQDSGNIITVKKFKHTGVRPGGADVDGTLKNGVGCQWEIKMPGDHPRESQLREQERARRSKAVYEFIYSPDEFFTIYDSLTNGNT